MSAGRVTAAKLAWIDNLALDAHVSSGAFRLAWVLASKFYNSKEGAAWPTEAKLADLLHTSDRQVRRGLRELVDATHVRINRGGRGMPNRYYFSFDGRTDRSSPASIGEFQPHGRTFPRLLSGQDGPPNPTREPELPPCPSVPFYPEGSFQADPGDDALFSQTLERWQAGRRKFPRACHDSPNRTSLAQWAKLSNADQRVASERVDAYFGGLKRAKLDLPKTFAKYLCERIWEGIEPEKAVVPRHKIRPATKEWWAVFFRRWAEPKGLLVRTGGRLVSRRALQMFSDARMGESAWVAAEELPSEEELSALVKVPLGSESIRAWKRYLGTEGFWLNDLGAEFLAPSLWPPQSASVISRLCN